MMSNKIKTVIASVLKPVDDTRMYEKFGLSLQQTNRYAVNIIGFVSKNPPESDDIRFYPMYSFANASFKRLFASLHFGKCLFRINPSLIIITTYELLPVAILFKLLKQKVQLVYDIRENYALNFLTNRKPGVLQKLIAKFISFIEKTSQRFVDLNILAELKYTKEISFITKDHLCILNKYKRLNSQTSANSLVISATSYPIFLLNGTISENYGIFEALDLANRMREHYPNLLLIIAGHVTNTKLLNALLNLANEKSYILTRIDKDPIPHHEIIHLISLADFGLVAHRPVKSIKNCFPTRIYEYMAHRKPFILQDHSYWTSYCASWNCSININFRNFDSNIVAQQMKSRQFYTNGIPDDIYWDSEEKKLIQVIDNLFKLTS